MTERKTELQQTTTIRFSNSIQREIDLNTFIHNYPTDFKSQHKFTKHLLSLGYAVYCNGLKTEKEVFSALANTGGTTNVVNESVSGDEQSQLNGLLELINDLKQEIRTLNSKIESQNKKKESISQDVLLQIQAMLAQSQSSNNLNVAHATTDDTNMDDVVDESLLNMMEEFQITPSDSSNDATEVISSDEQNEDDDDSNAIQINEDEQESALAMLGEFNIL